MRRERRSACHLGLACVALGCSGTASTGGAPDAARAPRADAALAADAPARSPDASPDAPAPRNRWLEGPAAPAGRARHGAVWAGSELLVWGGEGDGAPAGLRYRDSWRSLGTAAAPAEPFLSPSLVWTGTEVLVWGGSNGAASQRGARYRPDRDAWAPISAAGAPAARSGHTMTWTGSELLVWGGFDAGGNLGAGGRYDPAADTWRAMAAAGEPAARGGHSAVWSGSELLVWGGISGNAPAAFVGRDDGARYEPATDRWRAITTTGAPTPRSQHGAFFVGTEMIVFGGITGEDALPRLDGAAWAPSADQWRALPVAPRFRSRIHQSLWTGREILVWYGRAIAGVPDPTMPKALRFDPLGGVVSAIDAPADNDIDASWVWTGSEALLFGGRLLDDTAPLAALWRYQP